MKGRVAFAQRGIALAEWLLASVLGLLILMAALAWLNSSWQLAIAQRQPLQMANAGAWILQRINLSAGLAGFGCGAGRFRACTWGPRVLCCSPPPAGPGPA